MSAGETQSVNDIRTAIRELTARAELARKEGRPDDAAELERRIDGYRDGTRPAALTADDRRLPRDSAFAARFSNYFYDT